MEKIDKELSDFTEAVEDRIQNALLAAFEIIVTPKIEIVLAQQTCPLDKMRPVSRQIQNFGST